VTFTITFEPAFDWRYALAHRLFAVDSPFDDPKMSGHTAEAKV